MVPAVAVRLGTDYAQTLTSVVPSTVSAARRWNTARTRGIRDHRRLLRVANLFGAAVGSTLHLHIQSSVANGAAPPTTGVVGMIPALPRMPQQVSVHSATCCHAGFFLSFASSSNLIAFLSLSNTIHNRLPNLHPRANTTTDYSRGNILSDICNCPAYAINNNHRTNNHRINNHRANDIIYV